MKPVLIDSNGNEKVMVWDVRKLLERRDTSRSNFKRSNSVERLVKKSLTEIPISDESCVIRME